MPNIIEKLYVAIGADLSEFNKGIAGIGNSIKAHSQELQALGAGITGMGAAIVAPMAIGVKYALDFDSAMRDVNTMILLNDEDFKSLKKQTLELSSALGINAVDAAKAVYQAISAGVPEDNVISFLTVATKAAIAGNTDTMTSVDGLTTVLNSLKIPITDVKHVADVMFTTIAGGKTTWAELSASMFQVLPIAAASKVGLDEVSAGLATMTMQGVPTAQAATQFRQALISIQKPTKEMGEAIHALGYESGQWMLENLGLKTTLDILRESTHGSNEQLMAMFGSVDAGNAVLALTGQNSDLYAEKLDAMAHASDGAGAMTDAFNEKAEGAAFKVAVLKESLNALLINIGDLLIPMLAKLVDAIKPVIEAVIDWADRNPRLANDIVLVAGAIGAVMVVLGPLLMALPGLVSAIHGAALVIGFLVSPIGLAVLAIAGLVAAIVWVTVKWDELSTGWKIAIEAILVLTLGFVGLVPLIINEWDKISGFFVGLWNTVSNAFTTAWDAISGLATTIWGAFVTAFAVTTDSIRTAWDTVWNALASAFPAIGSAIRDAVVAAFNWLFPEDGLFRQYLRAAATAWDVIWSGLATGFGAIGSAISDAFSLWWQGFSAGFTDALSALATNWSNAWDAIRHIAGIAWDGIKSDFQLWGGVFSPVWNAVWGAIQFVVEAVCDAINRSISTTLSNIQTLKDKISTLNHPAGWGVGDQVFNSIFSGIPGALSEGWKLIGGGATGGTVVKSGQLLVGERGPELVNLPTGAEIIPNHELGGTGGGNVTIQFNDIVFLENDAAMDRLVSKLSGKMRQALIIDGRNNVNAFGGYA